MCSNAPRLSEQSGREATSAADRGGKRHAEAKRALRQAWERLGIGMPMHQRLVGGDWQLSIGAVCLEAGCSRNALYDGHIEFLQEIGSEPRIARNSKRRFKGTASVQFLARVRAGYMPHGSTAPHLRKCRSCYCAC
jgi:hypothetical protein